MTTRNKTLTRGVNKKTSLLRPDNYRVAVFRISNFKGLEDVYLELDAEDRLVMFTGENGAGKTTAARDAIGHTFGGKPWEVEIPQREGTARPYLIELTLAGQKQNLIATRTPKGLTLTIVEPNGHKTPVPLPGTAAAEVVDPLALDPIGFMALTPKAQVERLHNTLHLDEDLAALAQQDKSNREKRAMIDADLKELQRKIDSYMVQDLPAEKHDLEKMDQEIRQARKFNDGIAEQTIQHYKLQEVLKSKEAERNRNAKLITDARSYIADAETDLTEDRPVLANAREVAKSLDGLIEKVRSLPQSLELGYAVEAAVNRIGQYVAARSETIEANEKKLKQNQLTLTAAEHQVQALEDAVTAARQNLEQAPIGQKIDVDAMEDAYKEAKRINREIDLRTQYEQDKIDLNARSAERAVLQEQIDNYEPKKLEAIAEAISDAVEAKTLPAGLTFDTEKVFYKDLPLKQWGTADQLRIAVTLALASQPQLRLICISDGEVFDEKSLLSLQEMAYEMDFYIFMAKVETSGNVGIFLENRKVKAINKMPRKKTEAKP